MDLKKGLFSGFEKSERRTSKISNPNKRRTSISILRATQMPRPQTWNFLEQKTYSKPEYKAVDYCILYFNTRRKYSGLGS
jgi:hypothetical protein